MAALFFVFKIDPSAAALSQNSVLMNINHLLLEYNMGRGGHAWPSSPLLAEPIQDARLDSLTVRPSQLYPL